jgi:hypothetical protein
MMLPPATSRGGGQLPIPSLGLRLCLPRRETERFDHGVRPLPQGALTVTIAGEVAARPIAHPAWADVRRSGLTLANARATN